MSSPSHQSASRGLPTPPDSPRKRRRALRESEETYGEMPIELYIYASDPFRKSTVAFPFPLPLHTREVEPEKRLSERVHAQLNQVLVAHGITDRYTAEIYAMRKPGYPGGDVPVITLRVLFRRGSGLPFAWSAARDEAKEMLRRNGLGNVEVEIMDHERAFQPSFFPIGPTSQAVSVYERIRDELISLLFERLNTKWRLVSLFNVARTLEKSIPTIVVLVNPCLAHDWQKLEQLCKGIINKAVPSGQELPIEFLPGRIGDANDEGISLARNHSVGAGLGASMGVVNGGGGTMGGLVDLETGGRVWKAVLTNHHVIQPLGPSAEELQIARKGYRFDRPANNRPKCQVPHQLDYEATMSKVERDITKTRKDLADSLDKQEWKKLADKPIPSDLADDYEVLAKKEETSVDFKKHLQTLPVTLGKIMASSGYLVSDNAKKLDWGIIQYMKENNTFSFSCGHLNRLPSEQTLWPNKKTPEDYRFDSGYDAGNTIAKTFNKMEKGKWYMKVGRTTNITAGICNGTIANVVRTSLPHYDEEGKEVKLEQKTVEEYVVISYDTQSPDMKEQDTFCLRCDSGSFVINSRGHVSGLLHGYLTGHCGPTKYYCNAGLVASMSDIRPSIEGRAAWKDSKGKIRPGVLSLPRGTQGYMWGR
ncbi:hypothetical protein MMC30_001540 [Trapelia coarctata]|nr:hypothetical protein [Trapelia coarctata]